VIINSGSTDNLVSMEMVEELKFGDEITSESVQGVLVAKRTSGYGK
jgi:hypothetical protein